MNLEPQIPDSSPEEDDHFRYLEEISAYRDRLEYLTKRQQAHELNVAICNAIANQPPWED